MRGSSGPVEPSFQPSTKRHEQSVTNCIRRFHFIAGVNALLASGSHWSTSHRVVRVGSFSTSFRDCAFSFDIVGWADVGEREVMTDNLFFSERVRFAVVGARRE